MKANKIYLERLRKNDFVDRLEEPFLIKGMTVEEYGEHLKKITKDLSKIFYKLQKANPYNMTWDGIDFINPKEKHWTEGL